MYCIEVNEIEKQVLRAKEQHKQAGRSAARSERKETHRFGT